MSQKRSVSVLLWLFFLASVVVTVPMSASAQDHASGASQYHLTPDKITIIDLPEPAASTVIGNREHLDIFFDTSERAALVARNPGASHFQILNSRGQILVQGHALVAAPKDDYLRIRRNCRGGDDACQPLEVYFCPGVCHTVALHDEDSEVTVEDSENAGGTQN